VAGDIGKDDAWPKHKRTLDFPAALLLRRQGVDLNDKSAAELATIEKFAVDTYLANSRRRLDQTSINTWAMLLLLGVYRHPSSDLRQRTRSRDVLLSLVNAPADDVDAGVVNHVSRVLARK
jgi:hypothetical protein